MREIIFYTDDCKLYTQTLPNFWLYIFSTIRSVWAVWEWSNSTCFIDRGWNENTQNSSLVKILQKSGKSVRAEVFEWVVVGGVFFTEHWKRKRIRKKCFFFCYFFLLTINWKLKINISQSSITKMATRV